MSELDPSTAKRTPSAQVDQPWFQGLGAIVIALNAVVMGRDLGLRHVVGCSVLGGMESKSPKL